MTLKQGVRLSLWFTAPMNILVGVVLALPAGLLGQLLLLPTDVPFFYSALTGGMVALFGCGYFWMAMQENFSTPLLLMGACGKAMAASIAIFSGFQGSLAIPTTVLISGDLFFAGLWLYYLSRTDSQQKH